jgi:hypothetical protein
MLRRWFDARVRVEVSGTRMRLGDPMIKATFLAAALIATMPLVAHAQPGWPNKAAKIGSVNQEGWTLLGEQTVQGRRDRDTITVGRYEGKFDQIQLSVLDSDLELKDITITFDSGQKWSPGVKQSFKEGQRTRAIDLPGKDRRIAKIELVYANTPGGGAARVQVLGRDKANDRNQGPMPARPMPVAFDSAGWTLLGKQSVNGRSDKDKIKVGRYKGAFDQLTLVVTDSDLDLEKLTVTFAGGRKWSPPLRHLFKEGARTHVIDLPGKDRVIQNIELAYHNTPGGGNAKVEVYGRDAGRPAPPPPTLPAWEHKGWTKMGNTAVDGWHDRDTITPPRGKYTKLMLVVGGSDVELRDVTVTFGNGETFKMPSNVVFKEGTRTSPIDLPGNARNIKSISFSYANLPGGGRAKLEVWGKK